MKPTRKLFPLLAFAGSSLLTISSVSAQTTFYWDGTTPAGAPGGGTGTWNTSTTNWDTSLTGADIAWTNSLLNTAILGGTAGTLTLGSAISVGTIQIETAGYGINTNGNVLSVNAISVAGGGTSSFAAAGTLDITGGLSVNTVTASDRFSFAQEGSTNSTRITLNGGSAATTLSGPGYINFRLVANNTTGGITVSGGATVLLNNTVANSLGTNNLNINGGLISVYTGSGTALRALGTGASEIQITGGRSGFTNAGTVTFTSAATEVVWGSAIFNPTSFVLEQSSTLGNNLNLGGSTRTVESTGGTGTMSGVIRTSTGTAGITKTGAGELALTNAANSFNGTVTVSGGTLTVGTLANGGSNSGLGSSSNAAANLLLGNATSLKYTGGAVSTNRSFTINGTANDHGASLDASGTGAANWTNTASPAYGTVDQTRSLTLTGSNTGNNTLAANIADNGTGAVSLNKTGAGLWILSGTNVYTGPTTLAAGTLSVGAAANLGDTSSNLVFNGGTLQITGTSLTNFASLGRANPITLTSGQTVALDINNAANVFTVDQTLNQGPGGFTKAGAGTLVLNSAHTYTGVTTISAGSLRLGSGTATGSLSTSGSGINIGSGATFAVNQSDTVTQGIDFSASFILGSGSLSNVGAGSLVLNTPTFHTGNTTATAGNVTLSHQRAIQFSALDTTGVGSVTLSGTGSTTPIIGGLANSGTTRNLASVIDGSYSSITNLTLNPQSGSTFTYGGVIADGATGMILTKTGAGTQTLTGASIYTGATNINGGTLNLGGATATGSLASTVLNLGGGMLSYTRTGTNTQAFTTTNVTAGANSVTASLATQTINMGSLAGRVVGSTLDVSSTGTITTTTANDATGILGGWATITNNNWAVSSGSGLDITALATFYTTSTGGTTAANYAAKNIDIDSSPTIVGNISANTIRFNSNSRVLTLPAGDNIFGAGGILVVSGVTGSQITGGSLLGSSGGDLIVHGHGDLSIGSLIKNNGTATALTKSGGGTLTLSGTNTFSGGVYMNAGTLQVASAANLGDSANVVTFAGSSTLTFTSSITLSQGFAINEGVTGTLRAGNQNVTVDGPLSGSGTLFVHGTSTSGINLTFANTNNTFSGDIQIRGDSASYPAFLTMNSLNDTPGTRIRFGLNGQTPTFTYGTSAVAPLVLNHRRLEHNAGAEYGATFNNNATLTGSTVTVNTDLILSGTLGNKPFTLGGSNTGNNTFAGAITNGAGYLTRFTKAGAGRWILSNTNNSYTGTTTVSAGTLSINSITNVGAGASAVGAPTSVANGTISIGSGGTAGTLEYTGSGDTTDRVLNLAGTTGGVTLDQSGTGLLHFTSNLTATGAGSKTLTLRGSTSGSGQISGAIVNNSGTNTTSLTKSGSGSWVLSNDNTYTGSTTVSGGTLKITNGGSIYGNAYNSTAVVTVQSGGVLELDNWNYQSNEGLGQLDKGAARISINGGTIRMNGITEYGRGVTVLSGGATFEAASGANWTHGGFDNTANVYTGNPSLTFTGAGSGTFAKLFSGSGTLTKSGVGSWVLNQANTYTGTTTVQAGALVAGANAPLSANGAFGNAASALVLGNASTLAGDAPSVLIGGAFTVARAITVGTGAATAFNATLGGSNTSGTSVFSGGITLTDTGSYTTTLQAATGGTVDFQSAWTNNGNKAIAIGSSGNTGTVKLTSAISTSGGVSVNFGTLLLGSSDRLSNTTPVTVAGGILDIAALTDTVASFNMSSGSLNGSGTLTAATYGLTGGTVNAKLGAGAVTVNGDVTFSAADRLDAVSSLLLQGGTLTLAGDQTVASFQQTGGTLAGGFSVNSAADYDLQSGTLSGNLGGSSGLNKTGEGTTTLSGTNTYTGATNVNAGKLVVNGNISSSSLTSVASGATIGGSGTVGALTVSSGGFINPGNSPGILNVSGDYTQAGLYTAEITGLTAGTEHDQINVTGSVDITGGSLTALFTAGTYTANDLIFILLNDGVDAITGTYSGLAQGATVIEYDGFDWKISYTANSTTNSFTGGNDIALMAIPEPKAALLGGIGLLLLLRRRR